MSVLEARLSFHHLDLFGREWMEAEPRRRVADGLAAAIRGWHPDCAGPLGALAADAQAALMTFPRAEKLTENLSPAFGWISTENLDAIIEICDAHVADKHRAI